MKNQIILTITSVCFLAIILNSCSKNSQCQTCTLDHSTDIRVEVCPDYATTYSNNTEIAKAEVGALTVPFYVSTMKQAGYKCK